jgi:hypothetical protein
MPAGWPRTERLHLKASYVRLHENLLDLTHLSFLHARTFGTPDYATAPYETRIDEAAGRFSLTAQRGAHAPAAAVGRAHRAGRRGRRAHRQSTFTVPALHEVAVRFHACDRPAAEQPLMRHPHGTHRDAGDGHAARTTSSSHARNFAREDGGITAFMHRQLLAAFQEDIDGLEAIEARLAGYAPERGYWKATLGLLTKILIVWFVVSFGAGILFAMHSTASSSAATRSASGSRTRARSTSSSR